MPLSYPDTFYARSLTESAARAPFSGRLECETLIVGGGLAGLTTALELARAGQNVVLLEAQSIGFGASGRNGGIVSPAFACGSDAIAARVGPDAAKALHLMSIEGVERVRATIADLAITGAAPVSGVLNLRRHDHAADMIAHAETFAQEFEYPFEYLNREALRARLSTDRYFHGLADTRAFHMHPLNYLRAIAREIERLGGQIFEHSPVTGHDLTGLSKEIRTASGRARARRVVFATGGYTGGLVPELRRAILPIATYMMLTEAAPELLATAIHTPEAVLDDRRASDYYRLVEGGQRLLWGGRITTRAANPAGVARELRAEMLGAYPQLAGLRTEIAWSGQMGYARHLMPQIGQMAPDVWHCTAFGGHGLNTTAIAGRVLAEAILGQSDRITMFAPFGLSWAGGPFGLLAAQLTYWGLQAQDWWRERRA